MNGIKWTNEEDNIIKKYWPFYGEEEISALLPNRTYASIIIRASKYKIKKLIFSQIESNLSILLEDCLQSFYWIGFLMADGYINHETKRLKLIISIKDKEHLYNFAKYINCDNIYETSTYIGVAPQDKFNISKIIEKFDFKSRKTYNPPSIKWLKKDKFIAFLIGFIDGDGCIQYQTNRTDCKCVIKCHSSWLNNLQYFSDELYFLVNIKNCVQAYINNSQYAYICLADNRLLTYLKNKTKELNLSCLSRKWNKIDENFIGKYQITEINMRKTKELLDKQFKACEIAKLLNLSNATICNYKKKLRKEIVLDA